MSLKQVFGLDRVDTACRNFDVHITDAGRTQMLDIYVNTVALGLKAGAHTLALGDGSRNIKLEIVVFERPLTGERDCTDLESGNDPGVAVRWVATAGELGLRLAEDPAEGRDNTIDLELRDVTFSDGAGNARVVRDRFSAIGMGWIPG